MNTIAPIILLALAVAVVMALSGCYIEPSPSNLGNPYYRPDRPPPPPRLG